MSVPRGATCSSISPEGDTRLDLLGGSGPPRRFPAPAWGPGGWAWGPWCRACPLFPYLLPVAVMTECLLPALVFPVALHLPSMFCFFVPRMLLLFELARLSLTLKCGELCSGCLSDLKNINSEVSGLQWDSTCSLWPCMKGRGPQRGGPGVCGGSSPACSPQLGGVLVPCAGGHPVFTGLLGIA